MLLTLVLAAPAVAAKPFATYTVAEAGRGGEPAQRAWVSGNTWHSRGSVSRFETFLLVDDHWVPNGTETWVGRVASVNDRVFSAEGPLQVRDSVFGTSMASGAAITARHAEAS